MTKIFFPFPLLALNVNKKKTEAITDTNVEEITVGSGSTYDTYCRPEHSDGCFTEGLYVDKDGEIVESCGYWKKSRVRKFKLLDSITDDDSECQSGDKPNEDGELFRPTAGVQGDFLEGITKIRSTSQVFLLTYKNQTVYEFDDSNSGLQLTTIHNWIEGKEGWGLTTNGCDLYATTGDAKIYKIDPEEFKKIPPDKYLQTYASITVKYNNQEVKNLNSMVYITPNLWANQWGTSYIYRINPEDGVADRRLDVHHLTTINKPTTPLPEHFEEKPNGLAYDPKHPDKNKIFITGKNWPKIFHLDLGDNICDSTLATPTCAHLPDSPCHNGVNHVETSTNTLISQITNLLQTEEKKQSVESHPLKLISHLSESSENKDLRQLREDKTVSNTVLSENSAKAPSLLDSEQIKKKDSSLKLNEDDTNLSFLQVEPEPQSRMEFVSSIKSEFHFLTDTKLRGKFSTFGSIVILLFCLAVAIVLGYVSSAVIYCFKCGVPDLDAQAVAGTPK